MPISPRTAQAATPVAPTGLKPYWTSQCGRATVYVGDCREVLAQLEPEQFHAVVKNGLKSTTVGNAQIAIVTDPPYGTGAWLRDGEGKGGDCRAIYNLEVWDKWSTDWLDIANNLNPVCIGTFLAPREMYSLLLWIGNKHWRMCCWCKPNPRPRFGGQPAYGFDPFVIIGKVQPCSGKDWVLASSPRKNIASKEIVVCHPHQKCIEVMKWAVKLCCPRGGVVLDPFMGSGSTGCAAIAEGMKFVGVEQLQEYADIAVGRLRLALQAAPVMVELVVRGERRVVVVAEAETPPPPKLLR